MAELNDQERAELVHILRYVNAELEIVIATTPTTIRIPLPLELTDGQRRALREQYSTAGWQAAVLETRSVRLRIRFPEYLELRRAAPQRDGADGASG